VLCEEKFKRTNKLYGHATFGFLSLNSQTFFPIPGPDKFAPKAYIHQPFDYLHLRFPEDWLQKKAQT
jgi:hypothetical protein